MTEEHEETEGETKKEISVGFYFGNCFSSVGYWNNDGVEFIKNESGNEINPSYISFTNDEILVGEKAFLRAKKEPQNTIFALKSLIGRTSLSEVEELVKLLPFSVIEEDEKLFIEVDHQNEKRRYVPEELLGKVMEEMTRIAEVYIGNCEIRKCVIAVPTNFNDQQRQAMKDVGQMCGLNVLRIVNEATAGGIGCGSDAYDEDEKHVLVYRMGKFSMEVAILGIEEGIFEVLNQPKTIYFGGGMITQLLFDHCCESFHRRNKNTSKNIKNDSIALEKLFEACEKAKIELSDSLRTIIQIDSLLDGIDFTLQISRTRFNDMIGSIVREYVITPIRKALESSNQVEKDKIQEVIMIGGSTKIPRIEEIVNDYFGGKVNVVSEKFDPSTLITRGVTIQSAVLTGSQRDLIGILDPPRTYTSIGIEGTKGVFRTIIERNEYTPINKSIRLTNQKDFQDSIKIRIFEGYGLFVRDCNFMGEIEILNLPRVSRGMLDIEVCIEMRSRDWDSIDFMNCSVKLNNYNPTNSIEEKNLELNYPNQRSYEEIEKMIRIGIEKVKEEEKEFHDLILLRYKLFDLLFEINQLLHHQNEIIRKKVREIENEKVVGIITELQEWMKKNETSCEKKEEFEDKIKIFHEVIFPILRKVKFFYELNPPQEEEEGGKVSWGRLFCYWLEKKEREERWEEFRRQRRNREIAAEVGGDVVDGEKPTFDDLDVD